MKGIYWLNEKLLEYLNNFPQNHIIISRYLDSLSYMKASFKLKRNLLIKSNATST